MKGSIYLLLATLIWGTAFVAQSVGMDHVGPFTFQAARYVLAIAFLIPVSYLFDASKGQRKAYFSNWKDQRLWKVGILCGLSLFIAASLQQIGIQYTDAGKAGFITTMYIVLVPVCGLFFRKKPSLSALVCILIAVAGLYLLCGAGVSQVNKGDLFLMGCALGFAVQIALVDQYAGELDGVRLNTIQALVCGILSFAGMFLTEEPVMADIIACAVPIAYAGVLSMGVAFTLQIMGQKYLEPTTASLIMSLESAFAVLAGWLLLNERMTPVEIAGCLLVFGAVILSQLPTKKKA